MIETTVGQTLSEIEKFLIEKVNAAKNDNNKDKEEAFKEVFKFVMELDKDIILGGKS